CFFIFMIRLHPTATLFPYTTLFRSRRGVQDDPRPPGLPGPALLPPLRRRSERPREPSGHVDARGVRAGRAVCRRVGPTGLRPRLDRKSTRLNSSHLVISYAVFCLKK